MNQAAKDTKKEIPADVCVTPIGILSFPQLWKPKAFGEQKEPKYSVTLIMERGSADLAELQRVVRYAVDQKWPDPKSRPKNLHLPFRKGEEKPHLEGYGPGKIFFSASSKYRPDVFRSDKSKIDEAQEQEIFPGCLARLIVRAYAWKHPMGKAGVSLGLQSVQKWKDGPRLGGAAVNGADVFSELDMGEDNADNYGGLAGDDADSGQMDFGV